MSKTGDSATKSKKDETPEQRLERKALAKAERKKKRREVDELDTSEHKKEIKRIRAFSKDEAEDSNTAKRIRTRSVDAAEEKAVASQCDLTLPEWRKSHNITMQGHGMHRSLTEFPDPFREFADAPYNDKLMLSFKTAGFEHPTAIQSQAWPIALQNKDMICVAKTGSGKTCGFLLPAFHQHLQKSTQTSRQGFAKPVLLVLAPTRELSVQIMEECQRFGRPVGIRAICCYGGSPKYAQIQALNRGVECIIATPGRLNDLIEMRKADLSNIQYLVLDEADRMRKYPTTCCECCLYCYQCCLLSTCSTCF